MNGLVPAARFFVEAWARVYTLGLPPSLRRQRIDLIAADVQDEIDDAAADSVPPFILLLSLLGRCLRGTPSDITWRLFDARRLSPAPAIQLEGGPIMAESTSRASATALLAVAAGASWAAVLVLTLDPPAHALSYAGAMLTLIALAGWTVEARRLSDDDAAPSAWPLLLAIGIVAVAGGLVFDGDRLGLIATLPLALGLTGAFAREAAATRVASAGTQSPYLVSSSELARRSGQGDVIALEHRTERGVTRRALLRGGFGVGLASVFAAMGGIVVDFLWQRNVAGFGGVVTAGAPADFPPGSKTIVRAGKFWLVNLTAEQGGPGFLALWQKCPHLGCIVPWEPRFGFVDPKSGDHTEGWFRCPCHQSTYNHAGVRVYGPAPRSMDRMALQITEDGYIQVDTGDISKGSDDNATFAVRQ